MGQYCLLYVKILKYSYVYPESNKNGARLHHISWYRTKEGSVCLPYIKIQNVYAFSTINYCFGVFQPLIFLKWLCLLDTL